MGEGDEATERPAFTLEEDWRIVESLLPPRWAEMARELGAFRRARGFADPRALLQVMLIHLAEGCGLRETAARAELAGLSQVSDVALLKRLKSCERWFEWLAQQLRAALQPREVDAQAAWPTPSTLAQRRVRVVDGSIVREPGPTGSHWWLHYAIGLPDLQCQEVHLKPREDGETLKRFTVREGDIFIADRGYAHPAGVSYVRQHGADVIVRLNLVTLPLYDAAGVRWDILEHVRTLRVGEPRSWPVLVRPKAGAVVHGRLCAVRKSAAAAAKARERARRESLRGEHEPRPETLEAANYVFVFTTLDEHIDCEQVLALYRLRWQIELEFKRLKSLIQLGHLKKHDAQAARSWLQGKLFVALMVARLIAHAERVSPWGYDFAAFHGASSALPVA